MADDSLQQDTLAELVMARQQCPLEESFSKLELETLNRILEDATQEQQKDVSAAVDEIANAVVHMFNRYIPPPMSSLCALLRIKGTHRSLTDYLKTIDPDAFFKKIPKRRYLKVFLDYMKFEELEWVDVKTAVEELPVIYFRTSLYRAVLKRMDADLTRDVCGQLELSTSGDLKELHFRIQDAVYPCPNRDDVSLNGIAKVNRDSRNNIKSIEILSKNRQLRRVLVKSCCYSESKGLEDEYWDKDGEVKFDVAFYSRITVALRYEPLNRQSFSVEDAALAAAGIHHLDENLFADHVMNGRQIKNCLALAQGLAKSQKRQVTAADVNQTIHICMDFIKDMCVGQKRKIDMLEV
ncbi:hypothetical protein PROFUN_09518 [Planoprotostelium fungivorum]|uniref:Uncharacterized protein n=1 Tax=Planoprotostelium fungivorum TaxID=1890364 RepID=A0A2P6NH69_9EUKA|nr:hypothetical protein PROFUN_09518 [Planoprotostelium fungivorum]